MRRRRFVIRYIAETPIHYRRAIVQFRVVKKSESRYSAKHAKEHLEYLERDEVQEEQYGRLFGREGELDKEAFNALGNDELDEFRLIISTEDNPLEHGIDMQEMTREIMEKMEYDTKRTLHWGAVVHTNTEHPHIHVVIRGKDGAGEDLWIDREYIKNGLRRQVSTWMTEKIGIRKALDIERSLNEEMSRDRKTSLDRKLEAFAKDDLQIDFGRFTESDAGKAGMYRLVERAQYLERKGLAEIEGNVVIFKEGWANTLKEEGERHDIIKQMYKKSVIPTTQVDVALYKENDLKKSLLGRVVDMGVTNELYDRYQVTLDMGSDKLVRVELKRALSKEIKKGRYLRLDVETTPWEKPADSQIDAQAKRNGGIYDKAVHLASIDQARVKIQIGNREMEVSRDEFVEAHLNRLKKQTYFKMAKSLGNDQYEIPDDYLEHVRNTEETKVTRQTGQFSAHDVKARKGTWLDENLDQHNHADPKIRRLISARKAYLKDELKLPMEDKKRVKEALKKIYYEELNKEWSLEKSVVGKILRVQPAPDFKDKQEVVLAMGNDTSVKVVLNNQNPDQLKEGDYVRFHVESRPWEKPADSPIADVAKTNRGIYDAGVHRALIDTETVTIEQGNGKSHEVDADEFVDAHLKRLNKQAKHTLVEKLDERRFKIPDDYIEQMQGKQDYSRQRITGTLQQEDIKARKWTWLDHNYDQSGQNSELGKAAQQRKTFVQETLQLNTDDPKTLRYALNKLQRKDQINAIQKESGYQYSPLTQKPMEGTYSVEGITPW